MSPADQFEAPDDLTLSGWNFLSQRAMLVAWHPVPATKGPQVSTRGPLIKVQALSFRLGL